MAGLRIVQPGYGVLLAVALLHHCCASQNGSQASAGFNSSGSASDLVRYLFDGSRYDNRVPHRTAQTMETLYVETTLSPWAIIGLDSKGQILRSVVWLSFKWGDSRLSWDPNDFNGIKDVTVDSSFVWKPDFFLQNGANEDVYIVTLDKESRILINYQGMVAWYPIILAETSCDIQVAAYPLDTQYCFYQIGLWMYTNDVVTLSCTNCSSLSLDNLIPSNEWTVVRSGVHHFNHNFIGNYTALKFYMRLQRRLSFYTFALIVPCVLLTLLTLMIFFIPPQSGEKLSLGVATWTSLVVFLLILVDFIPSSSNQMPIIGLYNTITLVLVTLSLIFCILTTRMHFGRADTPPPRWLYKVTFKVLARLLHMTLRPDIELYCDDPDDVSSDQPAGHTSPAFASSHPVPLDTSRKKILNKGNYPVRPPSRRKQNRYEQDNIFNCYTYGNTDLVGQYCSDTRVGEFAGCPNDESQSRDILDRSVDYSRLWQTMAMIYDRLFFYVHVAVTIAGCVAVACIYFV